jgi:hypothetical protein
MRSSSKSEDTHLENPGYLLTHLPRARSILLPRTEWGHFGPLEQSEVIVKHMRDALTSTQPVATSGHAAGPD